VKGNNSQLIEYVLSFKNEKRKIDLLSVPGVSNFEELEKQIEVLSRALNDIVAFINKNYGGLEIFHLYKDNLPLIEIKDVNKGMIKIIDSIFGETSLTMGKYSNSRGKTVLQELGRISFFSAKCNYINESLAKIEHAHLLLDNMMKELGSPCSA
jgi:hypothetical protein